LTHPQPRVGTYRTRKVYKASDEYQSKVLPQVVLRLGELFV
jgi:hypothetical protein